MKIELMTKTLVTVFGALIMLASVEALAFIPPQSAANKCIDAVKQKYDLPLQDLGLETLRARPLGDASAVIYLRTAVNVDSAQQRVTMYCTVDQHGRVKQLRANPRALDVLK